MSLTQKFDNLRHLATLLEKKDPVPQELWAASGMKVDARLKDVQVEIQNLKKKVSAMKKEELKGDDDDDEGAEEEKKVREGRQDTREKKDVRRIGLDKKNLTEAAAAGAFDMQREFA